MQLKSVKIILKKFHLKFSFRTEISTSFYFFLRNIMEFTIFRNDKILEHFKYFFIIFIFFKFFLKKVIKNNRIKSIRLRFVYRKRGTCDGSVEKTDTPIMLSMVESFEIVR